MVSCFTSASHSQEPHSELCSHTTFVSYLENTPIDFPAGQSDGGIFSIDVQVDKQKPNQHQMFC